MGKKHSRKKQQVSQKFLLQYSHKVEKKLLVNGLPKRYDIIVYSKKGNVILLVECKAPNIKISQDVFDQIAKYNLSIKSKYLMVSNGLSHYFCEVNYESNDYYFLADIPDFKTFN